MKNPTQQESNHRVEAAVANIRIPSSVLAFRGIVMRRARVHMFASPKADWCLFRFCASGPVAHPSLLTSPVKLYRYHGTMLTKVGGFRGKSKARSFHHNNITSQQITSMTKGMTVWRSLCSA